MKKLFLLLMAATALFAAPGCEKETESFENISTPRTGSVPDALVGRWAIVGISGSTAYNIPSGSTHNTNEYFLGYKINKDGTTQEDGYISVYQYGITTWTRWTAFGSVEIEGQNISFHRARGGYTSSRNSSTTPFGDSEVYPHKTSSYPHFTIGTDSRGHTALLLTGTDGAVRTYVKQ